MIHDLWHLTPVFLFGNLMAVVLQPQELGTFFCILCLTVLIILIKETNGKGLLSRIFCSNIAGIHTTGKERTYFHICQHMLVHRIFQHISQLLHQFFLAVFGYWFQCWVKVLCHIQFSVLVSQIMSWKKTIYSFEKGFCQIGILEGQIFFQCLIIDFFFKSRKLQNTLNLRCKYQIAADHGIIYWLDSEKVSRHKQSLFLIIPDGKSKHSTQFMHQLLAIFFIAMNQCLCIRTVLEDMSLSQESFS